jgi:O-antigen/teichoic acid export membrane protein
MERAIEFILHRLPFISRRLDVHMLEVVNGAAVALVLRVLGAGLIFCFNFLLARTLGAEGAGVYFLSLTVTTIATVFGRMGLDNALLRFTAANAAVDDWGAVKGVYSKGMRLALAASTASAVAMFAAAPLLADMVFRKPELTGPMRWMALAVVPMSLLILHAEMLKGLKRIRDSMLVYGVGVPTLSLLGLYFLGGDWGINGAVWAYTIAAVLTASLGIRLWRSAVPQLRNIAGHFEGRELLRSSMPLFWVASLNMLINWTATFALGIWGTNEDVGVFSIASRTAMLTSFILLAVNSISAPKLAALYKKNEVEAIESLARNTAKLVILMASPLLLIFLLFPEWVMRIFGTGFAGGAALLSILAVGQFVNVATGSVGYILMMSGNEHLMRNIMTSGAVMAILLNITLVPSAGTLGAAIAVAICWSFMSLVGVYIAWSHLGIWTVPFFQRKTHS